MTAEFFRNLAPRVSDWFVLDQARVQAFADVTEDWQFIHLDPEKAAQTVFGGTVAHGFLTLSMLSAMSYQIMPEVPGAAVSVNYGFDRIRFVAPVQVGSRIRGRFAVAHIEDGEGYLNVSWDVIVEIDGKDRPALAAQWITRLQLED